MPPLPVRQEKASKEVTILVTGFGPFAGSKPSNLSYATISTLPAYLPPTTSCKVPVRIVVHPYDIPISYKEVREIAPKLYDAYSHEIDIWLHLGVRSQQDSYSVEKAAHRDGYQTNDDGVLAELEDEKAKWNGYPETLETSLDFDDVYRRWRKQLLESADEANFDVGSVTVRGSHEAGHTICDFLYYASLAECWRRKKDAMKDGMDGQEDNSRPILLLQIPEHNTKAHLRKARHITINMLRAMAESWRESKNRVHDNMADAQGGHAS